MAKTVSQKKLVPLPKLLKKVEEEVNAAIRRRDSADGVFKCISCSRTLPVSSMNAGHFVPVSKSNYLRFHPLNIHGECQHDNAFNDYHLVPYHDNLRIKIGPERLEWIKQNRHTVKRWGRSDLEGILSFAKQDNLEAILENYY